MESSTDTFGPNSEEERDAARRRDASIAAVLEVASAAGVQEAPTTPSEPIKIEREDLLEYKLLGSRAEKAELQVTMYHRELQRSQAEANTIAHEARQLLQNFEKKYNVDMAAHMVTEDGYLVPRPVVDRLGQLRR